MRNHGLQNGFTLIELMIVVAILAVISGVLLPSVLSIYDKDKQNEIKTEGLGQRQKSVAEKFTPPQGTPCRPDIPVL